MPNQPTRPAYPGAPTATQPIAEPKPKPSQRPATSPPTPRGDARTEPTDPLPGQPTLTEGEVPEPIAIEPNYQPTPNDPPMSIADNPVSDEGVTKEAPNQAAPVVLAHDAGHDEAKRTDGPGRPHLPNKVAFAPLQGVLSDPNDPNSVQAIVPPARPARTKP